MQLCPFARAPQVKGQVRYVVSDASDTATLLERLIDELQHLAGEPAERVETTLLIHPYVLADFEDYNEFLSVAEMALVELELEGVLQIASFHPHYQFAGTMPADLGNATNRSPYPTLHLLREASIERALAAFPDPSHLLAQHRDPGAPGRGRWAALQQQCRDDAADRLIARHAAASGTSWPSKVGISSLTVGGCGSRARPPCRGVGRHDVEQRVDDLVALDAEQRCAEDELAFGVDQHFHEALRLAALLGSADALHRHHADESRLAARAHLRLAHADPAERRVDEERIGAQAVADAALVAVEQVVGDDLVVVVRGVRERAAAVGVAERPDAGNAGAQLVVDDDVAARIEGDAGPVEAEVVGVGLAADRGKQMAAFDRRADGSAAPSPRTTRTPCPPVPVPTLALLTAKWNATPSRSRIACTSRETSGSSRAISRSPYSSTVTRAPKRRYICANSRPM